LELKVKMDKYKYILYDNVLSQETLSKINIWWNKCVSGYLMYSNMFVIAYVMSCKYADTLFDEHTSQIQQLSLENQELKKLVQQLVDERKAPFSYLVNATQPIHRVEKDEPRVEKTTLPVSDDVVNEPLLAAERRSHKNDPISRAVDKFKKSYYTMREDIRQGEIARDWMS